MYVGLILWGLAIYQLWRSGGGTRKNYELVRTISSERAAPEWLAGIHVIATTFIC